MSSNVSVNRSSRKLNEVEPAFVLVVEGEKMRDCYKRSGITCIAADAFGTPNQIAWQDLPSRILIVHSDSNRALELKGLISARSANAVVDTIICERDPWEGYDYEEAGQLIKHFLNSRDRVLMSADDDDFDCLRTFDGNAIPADMKSRHQWINWKFERQNEKSTRLTKRPYNSESIRQRDYCLANWAKTNDVGTWSDYNCATDVFSNCSEVDGIGYVFAEGDQLTGIDLDHCRNPETGELKEWATQIIDDCGATYVEVSPSEDGLHIYGLGKALKCGSVTLPDGGKIELFDHSSARYFTVTGVAYRNPGTLGDIQKFLERLHEKYFVKLRSATSENDSPLVVGSSSEVEDALSYIPAESYDVWLKVMFAIKSAELPFQIFDRWSQTCPAKYDESTCREKWDSAESRTSGGITLGTIFHLAKQYGYERRTADSDPILSDDALYGIAGLVVKAVCENSEADPAAVLGTFLVRAGAQFGNQIYVNVGDTRHAPRIFAAVVGDTARARKGTSADPIDRIFRSLDIDLARFSPGPLSSGEGILYNVRDASQDEEGEVVDAGVADKRIYIQESELGGGLSAMKRDGNTLSMILRTLWDNGNCQPLTKNSRLTVTGAHVCVLGHITREEFSRLLSASDLWNGYANRFLYLHAKRRKLIAIPRPLPTETVVSFGKQLRQVFRPDVTGSIEFAADAREMYEQCYPALSADKAGSYGAATCRAEAQVIRLSLIYSLLDGAKEIRIEHLRAALALWDYCDESARLIFGGASKGSFNTHHRKILVALDSGPKSRSDIGQQVFHGRNKDLADRCLAELVKAEKIAFSCKDSKNGGRKSTIYRKADQDSISA